MCVNLSISVLTLSALLFLFLAQSYPENQMRSRPSFSHCCTDAQSETAYAWNNCVSYHVWRDSIISLSQMGKVRQKGINKHFGIKYLSTLQIWSCMILLRVKQQAHGKAENWIQIPGILSQRLFQNAALYVNVLATGNFKWTLIMLINFCLIKQIFCKHMCDVSPLPV